MCHRTIQARLWAACSGRLCVHTRCRRTSKAAEAAGRARDESHLLTRDPSAAAAPAHMDDMPAGPTNIPEFASKIQMFKTGRLPCASGRRLARHEVMISALAWAGSSQNDVSSAREAYMAARDDS